jgi:hypothetical protein
MDKFLDRLSLLSKIQAENSARVIYAILESEPVHQVSPDSVNVFNTLTYLCMSNEGHDIIAKWLRR